MADDLIEAGFQHITVLDISPTALKLARQRLGDRAMNVNWIEADITPRLEQNKNSFTATAASFNPVGESLHAWAI